MSNKYEHTSDYIKKQLLERLLCGDFGFDPKSDVVGNEVLFSTNRRRCDLLTMGDIFHAFEIKGRADNLTKLPKQIIDYQKTFDFVSIVTTLRHLGKIINIVSQSVGIIIIEAERVEVIRQPKQQKRLNKESLLMFLGRQKLQAFLRHRNVRVSVPSSSLSVNELRDIIARKCPTSAIRESAYQTIRDAYAPLFRCFVRETKGYPILIDDIRLLSLEISPPRFFDEE